MFLSYRHQEEMLGYSSSNNAVGHSVVIHLCNINKTKQRLTLCMKSRSDPFAQNSLVTSNPVPLYVADKGERMLGCLKNNNVMTKFNNSYFKIN